MSESDLTAGLDPAVADLVQKVSARMADAPTVTQIRNLAEQALAEARHNSLTVSEIRQLAEVATSRARQVEECAARLAELLTEVG